jgi:hypothetical protein
LREARSLRLEDSDGARGFRRCHAGR